MCSRLIKKLAIVLAMTVGVTQTVVGIEVERNIEISSYEEVANGIERTTEEAITINPLADTTLRDYEYIETADGEIEITKYIGADKHLILPNEIKGKSVVAIGEYAFWGCSSLKSIEIPDSVTRIGQGAFEGCISLESIDIPDSVTRIGEYAFGWCSSLESIDIPDSVTRIGEHAFGWCSSLESIDIPDSVISVGHCAFWGCSSLKRIQIAGNIVQGDILPFRDCDNLEEITINLGSKLEADFFKAYEQFQENIEKLGISNNIPLKKGTVIYEGEKELNFVPNAEGLIIKDDILMGYFGNYENVIIPENVKEIKKDVFSNNGHLKSVQLSGNRASNYENAFQNCWGLEEITIDLQSEVKPTEDESYDKFQEIIGILGISKKDLNKATIIYQGGVRVEVIEEVLQEEKFTIDKDGVLTAYEGKGRNVIIPEGVTSIGEGVFNGCSNLKSIDIPASVTSIGRFTFWGCSSLERIDIPVGVTSIGEGAFSGCSSLKNIDIPEGVISIGGDTFNGCSSLERIDIPTGVISIGEGAFSECSSLKSIEIPASVTSIGGGAFSGCSSLENIEIPDSVTSIEGDTFYGCSSLKSIEIPASVTSIGGGAFSMCSSLKSIEIPAGVTSIGAYAFSWCSNLESIEIPKNITSIEEGAFLGCNNLTKVKIPSSVKSIGESAFENCSIERIILPAAIDITKADIVSSKLKELVLTKLEEEKPTNEETIQGELRALEKVLEDLNIESYKLDKVSILYKNNQELILPVHMEDFIVDERGTLVEYMGNAEEVVIPSNIKAIGWEAFRGCDGIKSIVVPASVTQIKATAFRDCTNLESISLPAQLQNIEKDIFMGCDKLENLRIQETRMDISTYSWKDVQEVRNYLESNQHLNEKIKNIEVYTNNQEKTIRAKGYNLLYKGIKKQLLQVEDVNAYIIPSISLGSEKISLEGKIIYEPFGEVECIYEEIGGTYKVSYMYQGEVLLVNEVVVDRPYFTYPEDKEELIRGEDTNNVRAILAAGGVSAHHAEGGKVQIVARDRNGNQVRYVDSGKVYQLTLESEKDTGKYSATYWLNTEGKPIPATVQIKYIEGEHIGGGTSTEEKVQEKLEKLLSEKSTVLVENVLEYLPYTSSKNWIEETRIRELLRQQKFTTKEIDYILKNPQSLEALGLKMEHYQATFIPNLGEEKVFTDVQENHWAYGSINEIVKMGIVVGMPEETFEPDTPLGVGDTFTMLDKLLLTHDINTMKLPRSVVGKYVTDENHWAFSHMASIGSKLDEATLEQVMASTDEPISRGTLAEIIYQITEGKLPKVNESKVFVDTKGTEVEGVIQYCVEAGVLYGVSDTEMMPEKAVTRAEMSSVLLRIHSILGE